MSAATLPKGPGYLDKLACFRAAQCRARRAQRHLDQVLRTPGVSPLEVAEAQDEAESLWLVVDRAGSVLARARTEGSRRLGIAA